MPAFSLVIIIIAVVICAAIIAASGEQKFLENKEKFVDGLIIFDLRRARGEFCYVCESHRIKETHVHAVVCQRERGGGIPSLFFFFSRAQTTVSVCRRA